MTESRRASLLAALAAIAIAVVACGGTPAGPTSTATATPVGEATPTPAAATPAPTPAVAEATPAVVPSFDLSGLTSNLSNAKSYRIAISAAGSTVYQATVVTEPVAAREITLGPDGDTRIVRIGTEAWMATGTDPYQSVPAAMVDGIVGAFDPIVMFGAFASGNIGAIAADLGTESRNGINTRHFRLDATSSLVGAFAGLPAGAAIDFWVADEGYLVGYEFTGLPDGQDLAINVTNIDDPANVVERPN